MSAYTAHTGELPIWGWKKGTRSCVQTLLSYTATNAVWDFDIYIWEQCKMWLWWPLIVEKYKPVDGGHFCEKKYHPATGPFSL